MILPHPTPASVPKEQLTHPLPVEFALILHGQEGGVGGDGVNYRDNETHGIVFLAIRSILKMRKWKGSTSVLGTCAHLTSSWCHNTVHLFQI